MTGHARGSPYVEGQALVRQATQRWKREKARIYWGSFDETSWWVIDANASWRAYWDALTALLLLYLAFSVPYTVAFLATQRRHPGRMQARRQRAGRATGRATTRASQLR